MLLVANDRTGHISNMALPCPQVGVEVSDSATVRATNSSICRSALAALRGRLGDSNSTLELEGCTLEGPFVWYGDARPGE